MYLRRILIGSVIALFVSLVIGQKNCFCFGFTTLYWKLLYSTKRTKSWIFSTCGLTALSDLDSTLCPYLYVL